MKLYFNQTQKAFYAYESDGSQDDLIKPEMIPLLSERPSQYHWPEILNGKHTGTWTLATEDYMAAKELELDLAIQQSLDAFAQTKKYANMDRLATYAASKNPKYAAEAARGIALRDQTWVKAGEILAEVLAGTRPVPNTLADIAPELPALTWE